MNEIITEAVKTILPLAIKMIFAIILLVLSKIVIPELTKTVIPWLKEKRLDSIIMKYVEAAEKMAAAGNLGIPKKDYVIYLLEKRGIKVTDEVDAAIESAVIELDHASAQALFLIHESMEPGHIHIEPDPEQEPQPE